MAVRGMGMGPRVTPADVSGEQAAVQAGLQAAQGVGQVMAREAVGEREAKARNRALAKLLGARDPEDMSEEGQKLPSLPELLKGRHVQVGDYGGISQIGAEKSEAGIDPYKLMMLEQKRAEEKRREDERLERSVEGLGKRLETAGIPRMQGTLAQIEAQTRGTGKGGILTDPNYQVKSAGPLLNILGQGKLGAAAVSAGEALGMLPKGASAERQALQRLLNVDLKNMSGAAVTAYEEGRNLVSSGLTPGGDPEAVKRGMQMMQAAVESQKQNIAASTRPEAVRTYQERGGETELVPQGRGGSAAMSARERLKAALRGGK